jgi:hypothetical protein
MKNIMRMNAIYAKNDVLFQKENRDWKIKNIKIKLITMKKCKILQINNQDW